MSARVDALRLAAEAIDGQRDQDYGTPEDNFTRIARLWSSYVNVEISPSDVAVMMMLLKIARIQAKTGFVPDNWVDLAGYAACGYEIQRTASETGT